MATDNTPTYDPVLAAKAQAERLARALLATIDPADLPMQFGTAQIVPNPAHIGNTGNRLPAPEETSDTGNG